MLECIVSISVHMCLYMLALVTASVHVCICSHVVCHFAPSHLSATVRVLFCCCSHCSLPPFISSLSLSLPHRLPITLHKARVTQATPFHLLSSFLPLLKIQSPFSFFLCLLCKACILYPIFCPLLTYILLYLCTESWRSIHSFYIKIFFF